MHTYCLGALFLSIIYLNGYQAQHAFDFNLPTCPNYRRCESGCVLKGHAGGFCYNTQCICYYVIIDDLFILTRKSVVPVIDHFRLVGNPYYTALQSGSAYSELRKAAADASVVNPEGTEPTNPDDGENDFGQYDTDVNEGFGQLQNQRLMPTRRKRMPNYYGIFSPADYADYGPYIGKDYFQNLDYLVYPPDVSKLIDSAFDYANVPVIPQVGVFDYYNPFAYGNATQLGNTFAQTQQLLSGMSDGKFPFFYNGNSNYYPAIENSGAYANTLASSQTQQQLSGGITAGKIPLYNGIGSYYYPAPANTGAFANTVASSQEQELGNIATGKTPLYNGIGSYYQYPAPENSFANTVASSQTQQVLGGATTGKTSLYTSIYPAPQNAFTNTAASSQTQQVSGVTTGKTPLYNSIYPAPQNSGAFANNVASSQTQQVSGVTSGKTPLYNDFSINYPASKNTGAYVNTVASSKTQQMSSGGVTTGKNPLYNDISSNYPASKTSSAFANTVASSQTEQQVSGDIEDSQGSNYPAVESSGAYTNTQAVSTSKSEFTSPLVEGQESSSKESQGDADSNSLTDFLDYIPSTDDASGPYSQEQQPLDSEEYQNFVNENQPPLGGLTEDYGGSYPSYGSYLPVDDAVSTNQQQPVAPDYETYQQEPSQASPSTINTGDYIGYYPSITPYGRQQATSESQFPSANQAPLGEEFFDYGGYYPDYSSYLPVDARAIAQQALDQAENYRQLLLQRIPGAVDYTGDVGYYPSYGSHIPVGSDGSTGVAQQQQQAGNVNEAREKLPSQSSSKKGTYANYNSYYPSYKQNVPTKTIPKVPASNQQQTSLGLSEFLYDYPSYGSYLPYGTGSARAYNQQQASLQNKGQKQPNPNSQSSSGSGQYGYYSPTSKRSTYKDNQMKAAYDKQTNKKPKASYDYAGYRQSYLPSGKGFARAYNQKQTPSNSVPYRKGKLPNYTKQDIAVKKDYSNPQTKLPLDDYYQNYTPDDRVSPSDDYYQEQASINRKGYSQPKPIRKSTSSAENYGSGYSYSDRIYSPYRKGSTGTYKGQQSSSKQVPVANSKFRTNSQSLSKANGYDGYYPSYDSYLGQMPYGTSTTGTYQKQQKGTYKKPGLAGLLSPSLKKSRYGKYENEQSYRGQEERYDQPNLDYGVYGKSNAIDQSPYDDSQRSSLESAEEAYDQMYPITGNVPRESGTGSAVNPPPTGPSGAYANINAQSYGGELAQADSIALSNNGGPAVASSTAVSNKK